MNVPFFTPKAAASTLVGVGSMGGGGGAVYLYQMPKNWKDLLIKEGYVFLATDDEYKAMFNDQKSNTGWTSNDTLKDAKDDDVKTKTEQYCQEKFKATLPSSSDANYSSTKQNLIDFCTSEGIKTVKARLIQSKKSGWIDENSGENKWKAVFAVYRYNDEFINWLKSDDAKNNSSLSKDSNVSEYTKLKTACTNLLKKNHEEITNNKLFDYGSWWCIELGYETIEDKIKKVDSTWSARSQEDGGWESVKTKWENEEKVKRWANKANSSSDTNADLSADLSADSLKKLCEDSNVKSKLYENDSYQEKYLVIKSVCKSESSDS